MYSHLPQQGICEVAFILKTSLLWKGQDDCRYETGFGVAFGKWRSSLNVTQVVKRKGNLSAIIVYLLSNGSSFRRLLFVVFFKCPNIENSEELTH